MCNFDWLVENKLSIHFGQEKTKSVISGPKGKLNKKIRELIKIVVNRCAVCKKFRKSFPKPRVTLPKVTDFNQIVTIDLKILFD